MNIKLFIEQIENADPNAEDLSIDDTNKGWGHCQFTASNLTFSSVLVSWDDLGGVGIACQLIVAVIKTCKVARHLCSKCSIKPTAYLSDIYLSQVIETLWQLWIKTRQVSPLL